jgi:hypothetical protein
VLIVKKIIFIINIISLHFLFKEWNQEACTLGELLNEHTNINLEYRLLYCDLEYKKTNHAAAGVGN